MENKTIELNAHEYAHLEDVSCLKDEWAPTVYSEREVLLIAFGKCFAQVPDQNEAKAILRDVVQSIQNAKSGTICFKISPELYKYTDLIYVYLQLYQPYVENIKISPIPLNTSECIYVTFSMHNRNDSLFEAYFD